MKLLLLLIVLTAVCVVIGAIHLMRQGRIDRSPKGAIDRQRRVARNEPARVPDRIVRS